MGCAAPASIDSCMSSALPSKAAGVCALLWLLRVCVCVLPSGVFGTLAMPALLPLPMLLSCVGEGLGDCEGDGRADSRVVGTGFTTIPRSEAAVPVADRMHTLLWMEQDSE